MYTRNKGSKSNLIFHFVERRCRGWRGKQSRDKLRQALSMVSGEPTNAYELSLDQAGQLGTAEDVDLRIAVGQARQALRQLPIVGKRDFVKLFDLFIDGYDQREMAQVLGVAEGTVSNHVKALRKLPVLQDLREQLLAV